MPPLEDLTAVRLPTRLLLSTVFTSTLIVLPTVTPPAAAARPVTPAIQTLRLDLVDPTVVAASPAPQHHDEEAESGHDADDWRPVAAIRKSATQEFAALGVTWSSDAHVDAAVQVRTRGEGRWSDWIEIEVQANAAADPSTAEADTGRSGSDLLYVGPSDGVQVRVDAGAVAPRDLRLSLVDPGVSAADAAVTAGPTIAAATAHAAEPQPAYVTRAQWGADESLRSCTPGVASTIKGGILHTTATGNDYTADQSAAIMRSMYAYHTRSLGWCDLGYNLVVDKFGTLFEGRYGGVAKAVIGAHTGGFNTYTFGVSMIGNHDLVEPTAALRTMVERVFAWKLGLYGIDATGTTTYTSGGGSATKFPYGTEVTMPVISGHRDYSSKSCPGNYAYPLLPSIRTNVAALMGTEAPAQDTTTMTLRAKPARITYGSMTTVAGVLTTSEGTPLAGRSIRLYVRRPGSTTWAQLSTPTTGADGAFGGTHAAQVNLEYRARYEGEAQHAAAARDARVSVAPAVSAALSSASVRRGQTVSLRGSVTPAHAGQVVRRQRFVNGAWKTIATTTIGSTGSYVFWMKPRAAGTRYFRVIKPADSDHVRGISPKVTLKVS